MISVIVVFSNPIFIDQFEKNIGRTIGVSHEIIKINNRYENYSIAQAYNLGANLAKFPLLIFAHEDILCHSTGWGHLLVNYFEMLKDPGVLGVAGSSYLPISPSDWWLSDSTYLYANFLSNDKMGKEGDGILKQWGNQKPQPVISLDGMFLAMKKLVWFEFPFDESLDGFHGYDTSICFRVSQKYQNYFVPGILLEHFSKGYPNKTWLINTAQAKDSIQPFIEKISKNQILDKGLEIKTYHLFLNQLKKFSDSWTYSFKYSLFYLLKLNQTFFSIKSWFLWLVFQSVFLIKSFRK